MSILDDLATVAVAAEFEVPTDQQQESVLPAPIPEGNYRLRIEKLSVDKDQNGKVKLSRDKWPTAVLEKVVVAEGEFEGRTAAMFQRVYSTPFNRGGGTALNASGLGDLVRAYDQTLSVGNVSDAFTELERLIAQNATFRGKVIWTAWDKDAATEGYASLGCTSKTATKEQHKIVRKNAEIKGMKKFPTNGAGGHLPIVTGHSGAALEARSEIGNFHSSGAEVAGL